MVGKLVLAAAKDLVFSSLSDQIEDAKNAVKDAASDTVLSMISGRKSIQEWAEIAIVGVDKAIAEVTAEGQLTYVGGKLRFSMSQSNSKKIDIAYELYFIDTDRQWNKMAAKCDIYATSFTDEAIRELCAKEFVEYDVEG